MNKSVSLSLVLIFVCLAALTLVVQRLDLNRYKPQIAEHVSQRIGRSIELNGPVHLGFSKNGLVLSITDAIIGNPSWASRPAMAGIGRCELGVALLPLLHHQIAVKALAIENADIVLETAPDGQHNWVFNSPRRDQNLPSANPLPWSTTDQNPLVGESLFGLGIDHILIKESQITIIDAQSVRTLTTHNFDVKQNESSATLFFTGSLNGMPVDLSAETDHGISPSDYSAPISLQATLSSIHVSGNGTIDIRDKKLTLDPIDISAPHSALKGRLTTFWSGARPLLKGSLRSAHLAPSDLFIRPFSVTTSDAGGQKDPSPQSQTFIFKDTPLNLADLMAIDLDLDLAIDEMPFETTMFQNIATKIALIDGQFFASPLSASLGAGHLEGQINLDGSQSPPHMGVTLNATDVNLRDLFNAGGLEAILSGKVNVGLNFASRGDSVRALASNVSGSFSLIGAGGTVMSRATNKILAGFEALLSGGTTGDEELNCLVAGFTAANGVLRDNGILLDTSAATVAGTGVIDLRIEAIDLMFRTKPKMIETAGFFPPLHVGGTFSQPTYDVQGQAVMDRVAGLLTGNAPPDEVPALESRDGQNACLAALSHSTPSTISPAATSGAVQKLSGKAAQYLKGLFAQ